MENLPKGEEKFTCPSCMCLVSDPVECLECETPFCKKCFESWFENTKECMQCRNQDGCKKLNRHLKAELMSSKFGCSRGCGQEIPYENYHTHVNQCDGVLFDPKGAEENLELDDSKHKNKLFVLDKDKPELLRYDTEKNSRIKISLVFSKDRKASFPSLFQFVFFRQIDRMFVVGGSNTGIPRVEKWEVMLKASSGPCIFEEFLMNTAMTGWEILTEHWKVIRKFPLGLPRFAHISIGVENKYIYSIGGKDEKAASVVERYEIDGNSETLCELNFPRYYATACSFDEKYIYVYGGYDSQTHQLLNQIERIDHHNPEGSPSLYELDTKELPCLTGCIMSQFNENSIMILGGKNKKFSFETYYFDTQELGARSESLKEKNPNKRNVFNYQSDFTMMSNEHGNDRYLYYIDFLFEEYALKSLVI